MKIINCITNSFFRTIGRVLAYLAIGGIIVAILSKAKLPSVDSIANDIFFAKVDASTTYISTYLNSVRYTEFVGNDFTSRTQSILLNSNYYFAFDIRSGNKISVANNNNRLIFRSDEFFDSSKDFIYFNMYLELQACSSSATSAICTHISGAKPNTTFNNAPCELIDYSENYMGDSTADGGKRLYQNVTYKCPMVEGSYLIAYFDDFNYNYLYALVGINRQVWKSNYGETDNKGIISAINNSNNQAHIDSQATQNAINNQTNAINNQTNATIENQNQNFNNLNSTITDDTAPDISSSLSNDTVAGWLPPGPIDSLVNLPLTLFNSITTAMGGTCSPLTVPLPFINEDISIPCMSGIYTDMGFGSFFTWIGVITSAFILFSYLMKLYKWVDDTLTFRENNHLDNWGGV